MSVPADEPSAPAATATSTAAGSDPAAPAPPAPAAAAAAAAEAGHEGSVKETIESILVAFILAFIFRAFVVEAFVIPTGSMAPTLLGAHMRFACTDCEYRWEVNYSGVSVGDDVEIPAEALVAVPVTVDGQTRRQVVPKVFGVVCPNCGYQVPKVLGKAEAANDATAPPVHYGDRILVLKYAYLLQDPRRWDVIVFKSPDPIENVPRFSTNYIKRLVGLPNEHLFILDGDIYSYPWPGGVRPDQEPAPADYRIRRKDAVAQSVLWRIVYDNDYLPHRDAWRQPWSDKAAGAAGSGWRLEDAAGRPSRRFTFDNASGGGWIGFDRSAIVNTDPLTDWLAYDVTKTQQGGGQRADTSNLFEYRTRGINPVGDLKLACSYERRSGDGPLRLELSKIDQIFTAEIRPGRVRLLRRRDTPGAEDAEVASAPRGPAAGTGPVRVEFMNVDYRVSLKLDGDEVIAHEYEPDVRALLAADTQPFPRVRIGAASQSCRLSHVGLWRDIYYMNRSEGTILWGTPDRPVALGAGEFFVLGDNALISGDARYWKEPIDLDAEGLKVAAGRVPERFLLGKAFFVYWPAGYRPFDRSPGLVPNFGDMRFIH